MTPTKVSVDPLEEKRIWESFKDSPAQRVLHNAMVDLIVSEVTSLRSVTCETLKTKQGRLEALDMALGLLHRNGKPTP